MTTEARILAVADLVGGVALDAELDDVGAPRRPLDFIALDGLRSDQTSAAAAAAMSSQRLLVGLATRPMSRFARPLLERLDCILTTASAGSATEVTVADLDIAANALAGSVARSPRAALALRGVLDLTRRTGVRDGLIAESLAYSMLLRGPEFLHWRAARPVRPVPGPVADPVRLERDGNTLRIALNRPERRNAFGVAVRDGLVDAFDLVLADPTVEHAILQGEGVSFCSGGDLDEFGSNPDVAAAHLIRLERSVAARIDACRDRVQAQLHGACIGAGIELPSFAGRVVACPDAFFQLPELAMGLIPGAGGTVGITRRIGRWRTAYLALSGERVGPQTALDWGLVDERAE